MNCLEDDWENELRWASMVLLKYLLPFLKDVFDREDYIEVYPEMIKRLDDAQDGIRIETCLVFEIFFDQLPDPWSGSLYDYCVKTIFIHLDDQNEQVQKAVLAVLKKASRVQQSDFIQIAREMEGKSSATHLCKVLLDHATGDILIADE